MRKESQQRKAVTDLNKVLETTKSPQRKSALNMLGISRTSSPLNCWKGYERVAGTKEFSPGSCKKSN